MKQREEGEVVSSMGVALFTQTMLPHSAVSRTSWQVFTQIVLFFAHPGNTTDRDTVLAGTP